MIEIGIDPVIVKIGFFTLRWYSLAVLAAAAAALFWTLRAAKKEGFKTDNIYSIAIWALIGGIVGSRLVHVIDQMAYYSAKPGAIIGGQGEAITGAILGGVLGAFIGSKVHKIPFGHLADLAAPGLLLAHVIGRIGCTINGDAFGTPTDLPWGVIYTHPDSYAPLNIATHPAVWYDMSWNLIVFGIILKLRGKLSPPGSLFMTYAVLYSVGRFFTDFFRGNPPGLFGLHQAQVITLLVIIILVPVLISRAHWSKTTPSPSPKLAK